MEAPREHILESFETEEGHTPVEEFLYGLSSKVLSSPELVGQDVIHKHAKKLVLMDYSDAIFLELLFGEETFWSIPRSGGNVLSWFKGDIARLV